MSSDLIKFQNLLKELFVYESADLDFGIYRILNHRRKDIEAFIEKRIPAIVDAAFQSNPNNYEFELEEKREKIINSFGPTAIEANGQIAALFESTPLGREYSVVFDRAKSSEEDELERRRVYNDLNNFFDRYYEEGDFISKRRRGRGETYAIPYNGEETLLHWANKDQYYIKTGERFDAYRFHVEGVESAIELRSADVERNSNKGEKRYFVLDAAEPVTFDAKTRKLQLFFQHRPMTEQEILEFGTKPQPKLNTDAVDRIQSAIPDLPLRNALLKPNEKDEPLLLRHLNRYTRKNNADYFIHKDLGGFLRRELGFYLQNDALVLDELLYSEEKLRTNLRRARVIREVAFRVIKFLEQAEKFQKRLFEKKKFVVSTQYAITLDRVDEAFWPEVLENRAQIEEWQSLVALDDLLKAEGLFENGLTLEFLRTHKSLMLDTCHFSDLFTWRLLSTLDCLDATTDGLLFHSENFQALTLMQAKYRERIKCIYIDPPYNTGNDGFLYRDEFQHSSWLSMMNDRQTQSMQLLATEGIVTVSIDDKEIHNLGFLLDSIYSERVALITIENNPKGRNMDRYLATSHEFLIIYALEPIQLLGIEKGEEQLKDYKEIDDGGHFRSLELRNTHRQFNRITRRNLWYPIYVDPTNGSISLENSEGLIEVLPLWYDMQGKEVLEGCWSWGIEKTRFESQLLFGRQVSGRWRIYRKDYAIKNGKKATHTPKTIWDEGSLRTDTAQIMLDNLLGNRVFQSPKPVALIEKVMNLSCTEDDIILDHFAGSGTTGHAVINLNRQDEGNRKYILTEMGDYFHTVLLPRLKKAVFSADWKDGKPILNNTGVSHLIKYHALEQYEETLDSVEFPRKDSGQELLEFYSDDYLLKYFLDYETEGSPALLNVAQFRNPFEYKLRVCREGIWEEKRVDLMETYHYLIGADVVRLRSMRHGFREVRASYCERGDKRIVTVWRDVSNLIDNPELLAGDAEFILTKVIPSLLPDLMKPDLLYVNGVCTAEGSESLEAEFARRMWDNS